MNQKFPDFNDELIKSKGDGGASNTENKQSNTKRRDGRREDAKYGSKSEKYEEDVGSWTFPYYSCDKELWLASWVKPVRADNR